jgi:hypothetical protein
MGKHLVTSRLLSDTCLGMPIHRRAVIASTGRFAFVSIAAQSLPTLPVPHSATAAMSLMLDAAFKFSARVSMTICIAQAPGWHHCK